MVAKDQLPFSLVEQAFQRECQGAGAPTLDLSRYAGFPSRPVLLPELRSMLLASGTDFELRDAVLGEIAVRAREDGERWALGLIGMVMPGLRRALFPLLGSCPELRADAQAEALASLVEDIATLGPGRPRLAAVLIDRAAVRVARFLARSFEAASREEHQDEIERSEATNGNPDDVLIAAVRAGVVTADEAELIGETRLGGVPLYRYAARCGVSRSAMQMRRVRAESRLAAWLEHRRSPVAATDVIFVASRSA